MKNYFFCIFYQVNLTLGRLLKWDWRRHRLQKIGFKEMGTFYLNKTQKYRKCPALDFLKIFPVVRKFLKKFCIETPFKRGKCPRNDEKFKTNLFIEMFSRPKFRK